MKKIDMSPGDIARDRAAYDVLFTVIQEAEQGNEKAFNMLRTAAYNYLKQGDETNAILPLLPIAAMGDTEAQAKFEEIIAKEEHYVVAEIWTRALAGTGNAYAQRLWEQLTGKNSNASDIGLD